MGLDTRRLASRADELGGGNQQKLAIGRCVGRQAGCVLSLMLLDEPTRGVDMGARADIYRLLRSFCHEGYAVVPASTDMEEVHGMADRIVTMVRGRVVRTHVRATFNEAAIFADIAHPQDADETLSRDQPRPSHPHGRQQPPRRRGSRRQRHPDRHPRLTDCAGCSPRCPPLWRPAGWRRLPARATIAALETCGSKWWIRPVTAQASLGFCGALLDLTHFARTLGRPYSLLR